MNHLIEYNKQFSELEKIVKDVIAKIQPDSSEAFFINNLNLLTKSFLVTICLLIAS